VQIGIFLDANHLPAYLTGAVRVVRVHNGKRKTRVTREIAELLASFRLTETDVAAVPVEPDRGVLWLTFRPDGGDMAPGGRCAADQCIPVEYLPSACVSFHHQSSFAVEPTTLNPVGAVISVARVCCELMRCEPQKEQKS
jgi:hypothetical protein